MRFGLAMPALLAASLAIASNTAPPTAAGDISKVLDQSSADWSAGNLNAFMRLYERSPDTAYVGSDGIVNGFEKIRQRYADGFGSTAREMGSLTTNSESIRLMGRDYALATGHYRLERPAGSGHVREGVYTLVFHRTSSGWAVISDHSS